LKRGSVRGSGVSSPQRGEGGPEGRMRGARSAKSVPGRPLIASHSLGTSPRWGEEGARSRHRSPRCDCLATRGRSAGAGRGGCPNLGACGDPPSSACRHLLPARGEKGQAAPRRPRWAAAGPGDQRPGALSTSAWAASSRMRWIIERSPFARWAERCSMRPILPKRSMASNLTISEARLPE